MFEKYKKYWIFFLILLLLLADILIFYSIWQDSHKSFKFAMLDVGQGDSLFIESPTGVQILVDGGPSKKILNQLSQVMSPVDRHIDAFIITNPDQDHIAGFLDVLKIYKVDKVFESGALTDSKIYQNLKEQLETNKVQRILARKGMRLDMGGNTVIDILFPDRDVSSWTTNNGSIVSKLSYKNFSVMLMGDASIKTEKIILKENSPDQLHSSVLKVGHHGSRSSSSSEFLRAISPTYAIISDGKNNKYGHPHQEILKSLYLMGLKVFRTDLLGTIIMKPNGENVTFSFNK